MQAVAGWAAKRFLEVFANPWNFPGEGPVGAFITLRKGMGVGMFYGWGKKSNDWTMPDGRTLICSYSYVSLMFIFKFVWSRKWHLIGRDRAMDIETNRQDLERMYGAGNVPDIGIFERFGMFITGGVIVALMLASAGFQSIFSSGDGATIETASLTGDPVAVVIDQDEEPEDALGSPGSDAAIGSDAGAESVASEMVAVGDPETVDQEPATPAPSAAMYEVAPAEPPVDGQGLISTSVGNPTQGWSEMKVHGAFATSILDEQEAVPGEKFLVIDYQLLGAKGGAHVHNSTFRVDVDGLLYSPTLSKINNIISAGEVFNELVIFTVPSNTTEFRLEAGVLDPLGDGYQASWVMYLEPALAPAPAERFAGPGRTGTSRLISADEMFTGVPGMTVQHPLAIEVTKVVEAVKIGPDVADPGFKFVIVDVQIVGTRSLANIRSIAFRMMANEALYPPLTKLNDALSAGEVWQGSMVFHVPADVTDFELEVGVPEGLVEGHRALFEISFE